jgi:cytidine deaminase
MITDKDLYRKAKEALRNAYAPFSKFTVGAALLSETGEVFTGVNVENSSIGATICAERTAFVKAVSEGKRKFTTIAVVSGEGAVLPCGICRQFMFEFSDDLRIITGDDEDHLKVYTIQELLPEGFRLVR